MNISLAKHSKVMVGGIPLGPNIKNSSTLINHGYTLNTGSISRKVTSQQLKKEY